MGSPSKVCDFPSTQVHIGCSFIGRNPHKVNNNTSCLISLAAFIFIPPRHTKNTMVIIPQYFKALPLKEELQVINNF